MDPVYRANFLLLARPGVLPAAVETMAYYYAIGTGQGSYKPLLPGKLVPTMVVTPAGFDTFGLVENRGIVRVA